MKKYFLFVAFLICNFSLFAQVQEPIPVMPDTIKTIDPYDEIVWEVSLPFGISDVAYHPNGLTVFAACGSVIHQRDTKDGSFIKQYWIGDKNFQFTDIDLSKDGKLIAGCGTNYFKSVIIFDVETGQEKIRLNDTVEFFNPTEFRSVSFSPDGKKLVATAGNVDNSTSMVYLFDVETGSIISRLYNPRKPAQFEKEYKRYRKALFSNDGSYIILASEIRKLVFRVNANNLKTIDTLADDGYGTNISDENICIKIDNNQEFCYIDGFGNLGVFYNLKLKQKDLSKSQFISAGNMFFNKESNKILIYQGADIIATYLFNPFKPITPIYKYKCPTYYIDLSTTDSLIISGTSNFQQLRLLKTRWDSPTSVNNEPQFIFNILGAFPNPTNNILNTKITSQISGNINLEILNLTSQILFTQNRNLVQGENNITLPMNNVPNGSYILRATLNNNSKQISFIINR